MVIYFQLVRPNFATNRCATCNESFAAFPTQSYARKVQAMPRQLADDVRAWSDDQPRVSGVKLRQHGFATVKQDQSSCSSSPAKSCASASSFASSAFSGSRSDLGKGYVFFSGGAGSSSGSSMTGLGMRSTGICGFTDSYHSMLPRSSFGSSSAATCDLSTLLRSHCSFDLHVIPSASGHGHGASYTRSHISRSLIQSFLMQVMNTGPLRLPSVHTFDVEHHPHIGSSAQFSHDVWALHGNFEQKA